MFLILNGIRASEHEVTVTIDGRRVKTQHYADFLEAKPAVAWVEVHSENYLNHPVTT